MRHKKYIQMKHRKEKEKYDMLKLDNTDSFVTDLDMNTPSSPSPIKDCSPNFFGKLQKGLNNNLQKLAKDDGFSLSIKSINNN